MRSKRRVARGLAIERLEDRVVMSSGVAGGYLEGYVYSAPGNVLTVPGTYDTAASQTVVKFTTASGQGFQLGALSVTPTSVSVVVPPYLNPRTLQPASVGVHVSVIQTSTTNTTTTTPAIYHLQITPKPIHTANAGLAAEGALVQVNATLLAAEQSYASILAAVPTATEAYTLAFQAEAIRQQDVYLLGLMDPLVRYQVKEQPLGAIQGLPLTLNRTGLATLDQTVTQSLNAPATPINERPDLVSYLTHLSMLQVQDSTTNLTKITPAQGVARSPSAATRDTGRRSRSFTSTRSSRLRRRRRWPPSSRTRPRRRLTSRRSTTCSMRPRRRTPSSCRPSNSRPTRSRCSPRGSSPSARPRARPTTT